ncbi:MAG: TolC family protein [Mariprofundaceae bacterium]|nr:TolC family protein [Mariprofundaceae bacterium]
MILAPLAFFGTSIAFAGPIPFEEISLPQAVSRALQSNRLLLAEDARLDEAIAKSSQANGLLMPRINAASAISRSNSPMSNFGGKLLQQRFTTADFGLTNLNNPSYLTNYRNSLTLQAPLYEGGRNWAARDRAEQTEQATRHELAFARQQTIFAVIRAYTNVMRLQSRENAAHSATDAAQSHLRQTTALLGRGIGIQSDILDARAHLSDTRLVLTQTLNARLRAMDELNRLLAHDHASGSSIKLHEVPTIDMHSISEDTAAESIIDNHPRIAALQSRMDAARAGVSEASAGLRPHVGLIATQEWNNQTPVPKHPNTSVGAEVSINLFAGGSNLAARHAAEARYAHLQYQMQDEQQVLRDTLNDAWRQLHEAVEAASARQDTLRQTAESLRIQKLRFEQGLEKSTDVLDAHTRNDRAVANDIDARFNLIVSRAALLLAAGRLNPEVLNAAH